MELLTLIKSSNLRIRIIDVATDEVFLWTAKTVCHPLIAKFQYNLEQLQKYERCDWSGNIFTGMPLSSRWGVIPTDQKLPENKSKLVLTAPLSLGKQLHGWHQFLTVHPPSFLCPNWMQYKSLYCEPWDLALQTTKSDCTKTSVFSFIKSKLV